MIENGATDQREIVLEAAAFFTHFEAEGVAELARVHGVGSSGDGLRGGAS